MILIQTEKTLRPLGPKTHRPPEIRRYTFASCLPLNEALRFMDVSNPPRVCNG